MMKLIWRLSVLGIAGALCFTSGAVAQVTMTLTGVGEGFVLGGVYVSPYVATIDGATTYVICDDFTTDVSMNETWSANEYSLADVTSSGPQKFTTPDWTPYSIQQEYDAAAILAEELMANMSNPTLAGEYSYAIWTLFDPGAVDGVGGQNLNSGQVLAVNTFRSAALTEAAGGGASGLNVSIFTPSPLTASQEYLVVSTPEASLPATLAVALCGLAGLVFLMRRRLARPYSSRQ